MSTLIRPFTALRPVPGKATDVAAPPYDVLSTAEARARAADKPWSFLHISKPEIDLPEGTDVFSAEVYKKGAENLERMVDEGILIRDERPCYYLYRLEMGDHVQTGLVFAASVADYDSNRIRKHEITRPQKEDDRVRQITALNAQTGPVLLAYRNLDSVQNIFERVAIASPLYDIVADDGVGHTIWSIDDPEWIAELTGQFDAMSALYIADGHHRSASASRVSTARRSDNPSHTGDEAYNYFLCVAFPHDEVRILDYNRVIKDLNGKTPQQLLEEISRRFEVEATEEPARPDRPTTFGMYLDGKWYRLELREEHLPANDPVASLDVSLLADNLIAPLLGVEDPRTDNRIDFVGGIRGLTELEGRVDSGEMAVAFALFPTRMEALMAVADADEVMPPKSTWFEPKLADGLISHLLD
jgi:uncharacterized protein (DUF1015 family)